VDTPEASDTRRRATSERARRTAVFVRALYALSVLCGVGIVAWGVYVLIESGTGPTDGAVLGLGLVAVGFLPVVLFFALAYSVQKGLRLKTAVAVQALFFVGPLFVLIMTVVSGRFSALTVLYGAASAAIAAVLGIGVWALRAPSDPKSHANA
jgi:hypothetical protein